MIRGILQELENMELSSKIRFLSGKEDLFISYLICLKHLCDTGVYDFYDVVSCDELYDISSEVVRIKKYYIDSQLKLPINSILLKIRKIDTKELLLEYLDYLEEPIYFHHKGDKIVYYELGRNIFPFYHRDGNATYIRDRQDMGNYAFFQTFDEILGIKNQYICGDRHDVIDYDYVYIYDNLVKIIHKENDLFGCIREFLYKNKNVVLMTTYNKISNFREGKMIARGIHYIILEDIKATILFSLNSSEITIINYDKDKIKDREQLLSIIRNNRKKKDVLIKIKTEDLIDNNYRIGFRLYQLEKTSKIKDINKIVDDNTKYLNKLNDINHQIEREINKLLNR